MKYVKIEEVENMYALYFTDAFYEIASPLYHNESYFNIYYRLFGLLPKDFYTYIGSEYHAIFIPCSFLQDFVYTRFKTKQDITIFAAEVDKRLQYFVNRGDFS